MKRCPQCGREYDNSMMFCLDDGVELLYGPAAEDHPTAILSDQPRARDEPRLNASVQDVAFKTRGTKPLHTAPLAGKRWKSLAIGIPVLALSVFGLVFAVYKFAGARSEPFKSIKIEKLTNIGNATVAQISPDGQYVAHAVYERTKYSLRVWHVSTKSSVEIVPPADEVLGVSSFSPDSRYIYYTKAPSLQEGRALYQIAVLGGTPKKILDRAGTGISFSPDAGRFAFMREGPGRGNSLVIVNADGSGEQILATRGASERFGLEGPSWSPDGTVIASSAFADATNMMIATVSVADGTVARLTDRTWPRVFRTAWIRDGSGLVFTANDQTSQVWHVSYPAGKVRRVTNDTNGYGTSSFSLTADSLTIATLQSGTISDLFVAPLDDISKAKQVTPGVSGRVVSLGMSWTPDGRIVYSTGPSGNMDIWIMNADGSGNRQLTNSPGPDDDPDVSPDGRYIVFESIRSGHLNIWRMDMDGGGLKQLTTGDREVTPRFSPDGHWVIYRSSASWELHKVSVEGGEPIKLTDQPVIWPALSHADGRIAAFVRENNTAPRRLVVFSAEGGTALQSFEIPRGGLNVAPRWSPDARSIYYVLDRARTSTLWIQPVDGGPAKLLADFRPEEIFSFAISRDGEQIVFARGTSLRDVVLITDTGSE